MRWLIFLCVIVIPIFFAPVLIHADDDEPSECGSDCLKSDFDGNGIRDYVVPVGEGWIKVFMNFGTDSERVIEIDAGGVSELYEQRDEVGEHGEPVVNNPSILVRWVGQVHVVYTWDGDGFRKISFPGFYEKNE